METSRAHIVRSFLRDLLDPAKPVAALTRHLTEDYRQTVDGKSLDRAGFTDHAEAVKALIASADVDFEAIVADGDIVASLHTVTGRKHDGGLVRMKVYAFFSFAGDQIRAVDEMTRLLSGTAADRDLGGRTTGGAPA